MPNFQYIAIDANGQQTTGTVQAGSEADATSQLRGQGLYPTGIVQKEYLHDRIPYFSMEDNATDLNLPDPTRPWCKQCSKHSEGQRKFISLLEGGKDGRFPSYRCLECKSTMWSPDTYQRSRLLIAMMYITFLGGGFIILYILGINWLGATQLLVCLVFFFAYVRLAKKLKEHSETFEAWSAQKQVLDRS